MIGNNLLINGTSRFLNDIYTKGIKSTNFQYDADTPSVTAGTRASGTVGAYSFTAGSSNLASGSYSAAIGYGNESIGNYSFTEGKECKAPSGAWYQHAEGQVCTAKGDAAHAEGCYTTAVGNYSHSSGLQTYASSKSQFVFGEYNKIDGSDNKSYRNTYVEIVGNGTADDARSDARRLKWTGDEWLAGSLTTTDVVKEGTWDGTNTSLATAVNSAKGTVTQTNSTGDSFYNILFSNTSDSATEKTESTKKSQTIKYNPYGKSLIITDNNGATPKETAITNESIKVGNYSTQKTLEITPIDITLFGNTWDNTNTSLKDAIGAKVSKSGDTLTGALNFASGTWNNIGDDIKFGDIDWAGTVAFKGINGDTTVRLNEKDNDKKYIQLKLNSSEGNAYIQTSQKLRIKSDGDIEFFTDGSVTTYNKAGNGYKPMRASAFTVMSSKLVKSNIKDITKEKAEKILELRPVTFDMWHGENDQSGMIAEEVLEVLPELVIVPENYNEEEAKAKIENDELVDVPSLDYTKFVPYLIKMVQEQQKEIDELKSIIND